MVDEELSRRELRRKERQAIYNTKRWKDLRALMIQEHPLCQDCLENGRLTPAEEVHHAISPFRKGLSPEEKERLLRRIELFRSATGTRKGILPTLVTTTGLKRNANAAMITNVVTLDDLFR